uniref:DUF1758 domain-containing protein n=1 Tax=Syphacia muris TaxID=451379 RepID=A0A0N5AP85_9BILA
MQTNIAVQTEYGFQEIDVKTVNDISEAMKLVEVTATSNNDDDLEEEKFIDTKPDILIGVDNFFKFLMNIEQREDGLYELSTTLGLLSPLFIQWKALIQELWKNSYQWDTEIKKDDVTSHIWSQAFRKWQPGEETAPPSLSQNQFRNSANANLESEQPEVVSTVVSTTNSCRPWECQKFWASISDR